MNTNQLEHIRELFEKALEQAADQRTSWLQKATDNPSVIKEVLSLLAAHESAGEFLEEPLTIEAGLIDELEDPMIGNDIGSYTIESLAGMGGSGAVYAGHRNDNLFVKKVAIKILKYGISSDYLLKRFQIERQTLANLQHNNITRLIDGGRTETGLPYLIMEFVDGTPITKYCQTNNLSVPEKIKLFRQVCDAVQYAHQSLIVHRDIKPGNILVTKEGVPKLMDFGIAKIIDDELSDTAAGLTMTGMWHLTPEYASPEQVNGEPITTASDIFSLGVLFYEILTGGQPIKIESYSPSAISKAIAEFNVKKPSEKILESETSRKTAKTLQGDLDNIVLKAMHKDPGQRYTSVQEFNDDLHRYLEGLPVIARQDSFGYKTAKFIKRHKVGVAFFIAIQLLIISSIILISRQRNIAQHERDKVKVEAAKSAAVNNFLLDMLSSADPTINSREVKVYDLLEKAATDVDLNFNDQPKISAAVKYTLGSTLTGLGEFIKAVPLLLEANETNKKLFGINSFEAAESAHQLGLCYDYKGDYNLADSFYLASIGILENLPGKPSIKLADVYNDYGSMLTNLGYLDSSVIFINKSLDIYLKNGQNKSVKYATTLNNLAVSYHHQFKVDEAENYYRYAIALLDSLPGRHQSQIGSMRNNLAFIYLDNGDYEKSEREFIEANKIKETVFGPDHPKLALGFSNLGMLYFIMKAYDKADSVLMEAIDIFDRKQITVDPELSLAYYWRGRLKLETEQFVEAEDAFTKSLAIREATLPEGNHKIWSVKGELGVCYVMMKQFQKAKIFLLDALEYYKSDEHYNEKKVERYMEYAAILKENTSN